MCGIVGVQYLTKNKTVQKSALENAVLSLKHRGPDANGINIINDSIGFGHVRLSIIDLSEESNQPFEYQNLIITFNGEIFNYLELKNDLIELGYDFRTASDTEVVLASYQEWGHDCVNRFNGMWAFAIYDKKEEALFCSRDRFGIKPFNYFKDHESFIFSSEIKAILAYDDSFKNVNYNSIARYCRETIGAQAEETWFENILRLKPAHNIVVKNGEFKIFKYWDYPSQVRNVRSKKEIESDYYRLLKNAVELRFRSDVPVGLTLSGGLDSSSIAYLARENKEANLNAYTASFPNKPFNEYHIAKNICDELKINSIEVIPDYTNYVSRLKQLVFHLESGHGSPAIFPLDAIADRAKKDITVYLEGQGADELMGGYYENIVVTYIFSNLLKLRFKKVFKTIKELNKRKKLRLAIMLHFRQFLPSYFRYVFRKVSNIEHIYDEKLKKHMSYDFHLKAEENKWSRITKKLAIWHQNGLVNLLHYGDAISMKHSMENRLPFMDYRLVEFIFKLNDEYKVNNLFGKVIHRDVFEDILPKKIINEKNKLGFVSPLKQIFLNDEFGAIEILVSEKLKNRKIFKHDEILRLLNEHKVGKKNHERILFKMLSVELWFQNFID